MGSLSDKAAKRRRAPCKLTPGKARQIEGVLALLEQHYGQVLEAWPSLTGEQRQEVLAHSPLLARLIMLARPWEEGERWRR